MGREVKRVPMDFKWPPKKTWGGYLNPHYVHCADCPACEGTGESPEVRQLGAQWYGNAPFAPSMTGSTPFTVTHPSVRRIAEWHVVQNPELYGDDEDAILYEAKRLCYLFNKAWSHHLDADDVAALLAADRLYDFTRIPRTDEQREVVRQKSADGGNTWLPESNGYVPSPQEVNDWSIGGIGHDGINQWTCVKAKAERLGIPTTCTNCGGKGSFWDAPENEKLAEEWQPTEPPSGDGWQMWETTTEGSPMSPVFATPEDLAYWLVETYERWLAMIRAGWVPSMIDKGAGVTSGVEACS